ncbi:hypothetical protein LC593_08555 [Nostoc sp. CHAB 5844]|nr:hypothetical protein [Nostoc sp. CHAB 5844]
MLGFIKKLIGGILGFITGLLPGKKKGGGYYLQLDESGAEVTPAPAATPKPADTPKPAATSNGTKAAAEASEPEEKPAPVAETEKKPAPAAKAVKAKASKNGKAAPTEPAKAPAPAVVATKKEPTETTFAPKYLAPTASASNGRRRPGANMSSFLDMASQVKTPKQA